MTSTVNIFMPTFNPRADFVRAAVDALLAQTEQEWKLLIHDDASDIDVRAMVEPYLSDPTFPSLCYRDFYI